MYLQQLQIELPLTTTAVLSFYLKLTAEIWALIDPGLSHVVTGKTVKILSKDCHIDLELKILRFESHDRAMVGHFTDHWFKGVNSWSRNIIQIELKKCSKL